MRRFESYGDHGFEYIKATCIGHTNNSGFMSLSSCQEHVGNGEEKEMSGRMDQALLVGLRKNLI
jgi:hypothetical protein